MSSAAQPLQGEPFSVRASARAALRAPWSFEALLEPVSTQAFCRDYFGQRPLRIERGMTGFYGQLIELARLERYLSTDQIFARQSVTMPKQGYGMPDPPPASIAEIYQRLLLGDSLRLREMECFLDPAEPVIALLRQMVLTLQHPKESLSCYVSPANAVGLGAHWDDTEIFTLQISGKKRWRLFHRVDTDRSGICDPEQLAAPTQDFVLEPGDLLYLPRGHVHEVTSEGPSFSLTIVFAPFAWRSLLDNLVERLAHTSAFMAPLPAGVLLEPNGADALQSELTARVALIREELSRLDAQTLLDGLSAKLVSGMPLPPGAQLDTVFGLDAITLQTEVALRAGVVGQLRRGENSVVLTLPGGYTLEANPRVEPALLRVLTSSGSFRVSDLAESLGERAKIALVQKLVLCGLLVVVPDPASNRPKSNEEPR